MPLRREEIFWNAVAVATGRNSYDQIFHVFLPPGQDGRFDNTYSVCDSTDKPKTFFFCTFHGSVDFTDIGHVPYSVEFRVAR